MIRRLAEVGEQLCLDALERDRRGTIMQAIEARDPFGRKHVHAGGQHLSQLDESRPQRLERETRALGQRQPHDLLVGGPTDDARRFIERAVQAGRTDEVVHAMPREHVDDFGNTRQRTQAIERFEHGSGHFPFCSGMEGASSSVRADFAGALLDVNRPHPCARYLVFGHEDASVASPAWKDKRMTSNAPWKSGAILALTVAAGYTLCTAVFAVWPESAANFMTALFHGLDFRRLRSDGATFGLDSFVYAVLVLAAWAFILGTLFAWITRTLERRA